MTAICSFFRLFSIKEIQSYLDPGTPDVMTLSDAAMKYNKYDSHLFILSYISVKEIQLYFDPGKPDDMTLSDAAMIYTCNKYDSHLFILSYVFSKRDPVIP